MKSILAAALVVAIALPAQAASVSRTYAYFSVGGTTLDELQAELTTRGPQVQKTGRRHPGATRMQFNTKLGYGVSAGRCKITDASVTVTAKVILPRWGERSVAAESVRNVWDTLSSDIRRHEESHVLIAKNYARDLEQQLLRLDRQKTCDVAGEKAKALADKVLTAHDKAQERFDRIEGINFSRRLNRLLQYRMEQAGRN